MKNKEKEIKYNNKTKFSVIREVIINDVKDENGIRYVQKAHVEENPKPNELFELGSIKKPRNKDVIEIKWVIPRDENSNPFSMFR